jgi:hypothetical protein
MVASRNHPGRAHEHGSIESPHGHLKRRIRRPLLLRRSNDFDTVADYQAFLDQVTATIRRPPRSVWDMARGKPLVDRVRRED